MIIKGVEGMNTYPVRWISPHIEAVQYVAPSLRLKSPKGPSSSASEALPDHYGGSFSAWVRLLTPIPQRISRSTCMYSASYLLI